MQSSSPLVQIPGWVRHPDPPNRKQVLAPPKMKSYQAKRGEASKRRLWGVAVARSLMRVSLGSKATCRNGWDIGFDSCTLPAADSRVVTRSAVLDLDEKVTTGQPAFQRGIDSSPNASDLSSVRMNEGHASRQP